MGERSEYGAQVHLDTEGNETSLGNVGYDDTSREQMQNDAKDRWIARQPHALVAHVQENPFTEAESEMAQSILDGRRVVEVSRDSNYGVPLTPDAAQNGSLHLKDTAERDANAIAAERARLDELLAEGDDRFINQGDRQEADIVISEASAKAQKTIEGLKSLRATKANDPIALATIDARIKELEREI